MDYSDYLKHAWSVYFNAVSADGAERHRLLIQAKQILQNIPNGYDNRDELLSRIETML